MTKDEIEITVTVATCPNADGKMTEAQFQACMYEYNKSNFALRISAKSKNWLVNSRQILCDICAKNNWPIEDFEPEFAAIDEQLALKDNVSYINTGRTWNFEI